MTWNTWQACIFYPPYASVGTMLSVSTRAGPGNDLLRTRLCGVWVVISSTWIWYAYLNGWKKLRYAFRVSVTWNWMRVRMFLFYRSAWPPVCEWYAVVTRCCTLWKVRMVANNLVTRSTPISVRRYFRKFYVIFQWLKNRFAIFRKVTDEDTEWMRLWDVDVSSRSYNRLASFIVYPWLDNAETGCLFKSPHTTFGKILQ